MQYAIILNCFNLGIAGDPHSFPFTYYNNPLIQNSADLTLLVQDDGQKSQISKGLLSLYVQGQVIFIFINIYSSLVLDGEVESWVLCARRLLD